MVLKSFPLYWKQSIYGTGIWFAQTVSKTSFIKSIKFGSWKIKNRFENGQKTTHNMQIYEIPALIF